MNKQDRKEKIDFVFAKTDCGGLVPHRVVEPPPTMIELPPGCYEVRVDQENGPHFHAIDQIKPPAKMYGKVNSHIDRYFRSFEKGKGNMGVQLIGRKGTGKSAELLAMHDKALQLQMAVIVVNTFVNAVMLGRLLSTVKQDLLVTFDEYEKNYGAVKEYSSVADELPDQVGILGLLDGASGGGKKLFVLAANDDEKISQYMKGRPSRIRYTKKFEHLPLDVVAHYVRENLVNSTNLQRSHIYKLISATHQQFNFDMMKALVEEINEYKEDVFTACSALFSGLALPEVSAKYLVTFKDADGVEHDFAGNESYDGNGNFRITVDGEVDPETGQHRPDQHFKLFDSELVDFRDDGSMFYVKDEVQYYLYPLSNAMMNSGWTNHKWTPEEQAMMERAHKLIERRSQAIKAFQIADSERKRQAQEAANEQAAIKSGAVAGGAEVGRIGGGGVVVGGQAASSPELDAGVHGQVGGSGDGANQAVSQGRAEQGAGRADGVVTQPDGSYQTAFGVRIGGTSPESTSSDSGSLLEGTITYADYPGHTLNGGDLGGGATGLSIMEVGGLQAGDIVSFRDDGGHVKLSNNNMYGAHMPTFTPVYVSFGSKSVDQPGDGNLSKPGDLPW